MPCPRGIRCQYEQMPVVDLISTYFFFRQTIGLRRICVSMDFDDVVVVVVVADVAIVTVVRPGANE